MFFIIVLYQVIFSHCLGEEPRRRLHMEVSYLSMGWDQWGKRVMCVCVCLTCTLNNKPTLLDMSQATIWSGEVRCSACVWIIIYFFSFNCLGLELFSFVFLGIYWACLVWPIDAPFWAGYYTWFGDIFYQRREYCYGQIEWTHTVPIFLTFNLFF